MGRGGLPDPQEDLPASKGVDPVPPGKSDDPIPSPPSLEEKRYRPDINQFIHSSLIIEMSSGLFSQNKREKKKK